MNKAEISDQNDAVDLLIEAWRGGRPIVFFLGSGFSVETGFPTIQQLCRYLAHLQFAFHCGLYDRHMLAFRSHSESTRTARKSELIEFLGWPTPEQLRADLWRWWSRNDSKFFQSWYDYVSQHRILNFEENEFSRWQKILIEEVQLGPHEWFRWIEQAVFLAELGERYDINLARQAAEEQFFGSWRRRVLWRSLDCTNRVPSEILKSMTRVSSPNDLRGDWLQLLDTLTEGVPDFIDALFVGLSKQRKPAISHRYLAFLTRQLSVPLILTTNFDPFVEQALSEEGLAPQVFDVFRDATLPHPQLVRTGLSVVKLHGSAYGLRVGERLQLALTVNDRERLLQYLPSRSLLVLIGFSGWERRMMQFIEHFLRDPDRKSSLDKHHVLWLHQEPNTPPPPEQLGRQLRQTDRKAADGLLNQHIPDAGTFLAALQAKFASTYMTSRIGYTISPPIRVNEPDATRSKPLFDPWQQLQIFCPEPALLSSEQPPLLMSRTADGKTTHELDSIRKERFGLETTLAMARFAAAHQREYTTIWIDLEEHHTVEGVVADILQRMRSYDPGLSTIVLPFDPYDAAKPSDELSPGLKKACERIWDAMHRRRYLLCFDQIEAFGRAQTAHHGIDHQARPNYFGPPLESLRKFLLYLTLSQNGDHHGGPPADALFAFGLDAPRERHFLLDEDPGDRWSEARKSCDSLLSELLIRKDASAPRLFRRDDIHHLAHEGKERTRWNAFEVLREQSPEELTEWFTRTTLETGFGHHLETSETETHPQAVILVQLCIFRRPRSLVAIRTLIPRHWGRFARMLPEPMSKTRWRHERVDRLLKELELDGCLHRYPGETYSLDPTVHELSYKLLTENVRTQRIAELVKTLRHYSISPTTPRRRSIKKTAINMMSNGSQVAEALTELGAALRSCLTLSYWHRRTARYYYSCAYLPTHDLTAFWEYVYHRISALRYLTIAEGILRGCAVAVKDGLTDESQLAVFLTPKILLKGSLLHGTLDVLTRWTKEAQLLLRNNSPLLRIAELKAWAPLFGLFACYQQLSPNYSERLDLLLSKRASTMGAEDDPSTPLQLLIGLLHLNRNVHLRSIERTFKRMRDPLLSAAPAATIVAWCRHLLLHDLPELDGDHLLRTHSSPHLKTASASRPTDSRNTDDPKYEIDKFWASLPIDLLLQEPACANRAGKGSRNSFEKMPVSFAIRRFQESLRDLMGTVTFLRRDYAACLRASWQDHATPGHLLNALEQSEEFRDLARTIRRLATCPRSELTSLVQSLEEVGSTLEEWPKALHGSVVDESVSSTTARRDGLVAQRNHALNLAQHLHWPAPQFLHHVL